MTAISIIGCCEGTWLSRDHHVLARDHDEGGKKCESGLVWPGLRLGVGATG